jgi:hypothetical protein
MCAQAADPPIPFPSKEIGNGEVRDVLVEGFQDSNVNEGSPEAFYSCWRSLLGWPWWRNWNQELFSIE